jgi:hypothetical protein
MRGEIIPAKVSLDLDDAGGATSRIVIPDEVRSEQCSAGLQAGASQGGPGEALRTVQRSG